MCLSIPGKIVSIDESTPELRMGKVDFSGIQKDVCLQWVPEALLGDYVLVHVGFALTKIDEDEAMTTLSLMTELGEALGREDNEEYQTFDSGTGNIQNEPDAKTSTTEQPPFTEQSPDTERSRSARTGAPNEIR